MILLAASAGGHVAQLHTLRSRLVGDQDVVWATFQTPQTVSLLEDQEVEWLKYIPPRGVRQVVGNVPRVWDVLRKRRVDHVYSTGAGIALVVFLIARARGIPCTYIESAARGRGPSLTGRLVSRLPGVECRTQYRSWAGGRWSYRESIFDDFSTEPVDHPSVKRVTVTMGSIRPYGFDRLLDRLIQVVPANVEVLCQLGETQLGERLLPPNFEFVASLPGKELERRTAESDAVVAHAGIGSALMAFNAGLRPVLAVRRSAHDEHVDDHQEQISRELAGRDLAIAVEADEMTWADIVESAQRRIITRATN
ncbi:MAG: glycosyl transferase family 28 [Gordonia polyisoprenivorans]|nr:glycosyl transferase family 28 [Gordonia polyisoprenivorans]